MDRLCTFTVVMMSACMLPACSAPPAATQRAKASFGSNGFGGGNDIFCDDPNPDAYCKTIYGSSARAVLAASNDANAWRCQLGTKQLSLSMNDACLQQCGNPSVAYETDDHDPYSWSCTNAATPYCENADGSMWMDITSVTAAGATGQGGYEVYGESSPWTMSVSANQFAGYGTNIMPVPAALDGVPFTAWLRQGTNLMALDTAPITPSSPVQHTVTLNTVCGTRTWTTPPLRRTYPTAAPVPSVSVSADYVNSGTPVTLTVQRQSISATTCISNSLLRVIGKQPYDDSVVLDLTFSGGEFLSKTLTVKPQITTEYSATYYCIGDPSIKSTAKATVDVYGGPLATCAGNTPPPTFWFCRDCPYNTPPLTNTIVQTACTYDQALQLASQTTFGGTCNLADGKCPSCPNPASCPPQN